MEEVNAGMYKGEKRGKMERVKKERSKEVNHRKGGGTREC